MSQAPAAPLLPPTWESLNGEFNPEAFRAMMASHVARQRIRWFRSWPDPGLDFTTGAFPAGESGLERDEVTGATVFWAMVATADRFAKQIGAVGQIPVGQMQIITMSDELPLAEGDIVVLLGKTISQGIPDAPWRTGKRTLVRGATREVRQGLISGTGVAVTGVGTAFTLDLRVGSIIEVLGIRAVVASIASNTALTLTAATTLPQTVTSAEWARCEDVLPFWPVLRIVGMRTAVGTVPPDAYQVSAAGDRIEWLTLADMPAPGAKFSMIWDYMPRYVVRELRGYSRATPVQGVGMPQMVMVDELVGSASS